MNITSVLSNSYLQPLRDSMLSTEDVRASAELSAREQRVLAQERGIKTASGAEAKVSTTYHYSVGPDGRRYVTGAEVKVEVEAQPNEGTSPQKAGLGEKTEEKVSASSGLNTKTKEAVRELQRIEREVVAHEAAHQAAGGALAGAVSYSYTRGPDGRNYITGGEVPIHVPSSSNPEHSQTYGYNIS